mgnify:CR=1 FL=1
MRRAASALLLLGAACASHPTRTHFRVDPIPEIAGTVGMVAVTALIDREKKDWFGMRACLGDARAPTDGTLSARPQKHAFPGAPPHDCVPRLSPGRPRR